MMSMAERIYNPVSAVVRAADENKLYIKEKICLSGKTSAHFCSGTA